MSKTSIIPRSNNPYLNHTFFRSRKLSWLALLGGSVCMGSVVVLGNTVLGRWMQFLAEDTRNGEVIVPSRKLRPLKDIVLSDLKLADTTKVKLFSTSSDVCEVYGSINAFNGAYVGIPSYLNFEKKEDIELDLLVADEEKKEITEKYLSSFVLSENAKLYVIAEGLALVRQPNHFLIPSLSSSLCFLASFLQAQIVVKYWFRGKSPPLKLWVYSLCALIWCVGFIIISDRTNLYIFENTVKCLKSNYIDGGIEFYEKALLRNEIKCSNFANVGWETRYLSSVFSDRLEVLNRLKDEKLAQ